MQANGQKDPQELRGFLNDVRQAAYTIRNHMERNFGKGTGALPMIFP